MKSFEEFKLICEDAKSKANADLEAAELAAAEASIVRDEKGKEVKKTRRYYLQNNPKANAAHQARQRAAQDGVMNAQNRIAQLQQKAQVKQQEAQLRKQEQMHQRQQQMQAEKDAATQKQVEAEKAEQARQKQEAEANKPAPDKKEMKRRAEFRKTLNRAQQKGLQGKYS